MEEAEDGPSAVLGAHMSALRINFRQLILGGNDCLTAHVSCLLLSPARIQRSSQHHFFLKQGHVELPHELLWTHHCEDQV